MLANCTGCGASNLGISRTDLVLIDGTWSVSYTHLPVICKPACIGVAVGIDKTRRQNHVLSVYYLLRFSLNPVRYFLYLIVFYCNLAVIPRRACTIYDPYILEYYIVQTYHSFSLCYEQSPLLPLTLTGAVSYTHLDVYKRQNSYDRRCNFRIYRHGNYHRAWPRPVLPMYFPEKACSGSRINRSPGPNPRSYKMCIRDSYIKMLSTL